MPQPLSKVTPKALVFIGGAGERLISKRPELAILAMEAISSWSNVELFLLNLYLNLFGGRSQDAAKIYLSLEVQSGKTAAILAIANDKLSKEHLTLLQAILAVSKINQKSRDKLAHHVWGLCPTLTDALLLFDSKAELSSLEDFDKVFVYKETDFQSIINANDRLCGFVLRFNLMLSQDKFVAQQQYDELCLEPEIRERLDRQA